MLNKIFSCEISRLCGCESCFLMELSQQVFFLHFVYKSAIRCSTMMCARSKHAPFPCSIQYKYCICNLLLWVCQRLRHDESPHELWLHPVAQLRVHAERGQVVRFHSEVGRQSQVQQVPGQARFASLRMPPATVVLQGVRVPQKTIPVVWHWLAKMGV